MSKLKTLKDLETTGLIDGYSHGIFTIVSSVKLKQEAIKWIKRFIRDYPGIEFKDIGETFSPDGNNPFGFACKKTKLIEEYCCGYSLIAFIKHLFNITEEELK